MIEYIRANWLTWHLLWLLSRHMVWVMHWTFRSILIVPYRVRQLWNSMCTRLLWQVDATITIRSMALPISRNVRSIDYWLLFRESVLTPLVWFSHHWHLQNFCNVIANGDEKMLKTVKGIGLLQHNVAISSLTWRTRLCRAVLLTNYVSSQPNTPAVNAAIKDQAVSALTMLGFSPCPICKVVVSILAEQPDLPVEQVVASVEDD